MDWESLLNVVEGDITEIKSPEKKPEKGKR